MSIDRWDIAMRHGGARGSSLNLQLNLPAPLSKALADRGYNRVVIQLVPEGILLKPYAAEIGEGRTVNKLPAVDLPFGGEA